MPHQQPSRTTHPLQTSTPDDHPYQSAKSRHADKTLPSSTQWLAGMVRVAAQPKAKPNKSYCLQHEDYKHNQHEDCKRNLCRQGTHGMVWHAVDATLCEQEHTRPHTTTAHQQPAT